MCHLLVIYLYFIYFIYKFDFIIKNIVENVSDEIKRRKYEYIKTNVLNSIIEHVITQHDPYFKFVLGWWSFLYFIIFNIYQFKDYL